MGLPCNLIPSLSPESESQRKGIGPDTASKTVRHGLLADWKEGLTTNAASNLTKSNFRESLYKHPNSHSNVLATPRKKVKAAAREASFLMTRGSLRLYAFWGNLSLIGIRPPAFLRSDHRKTKA
ncbi:hypothetical protein VNO77_49250 [Canavalia gladiata]|uniref:Uncharacterized protein n=1 Tax=Canavalia gladiata TaxID=3824 RepID=A0AAN9JBL4_CANGL